jgi:Beta-lactamase
MRKRRNGGSPSARLKDSFDNLQVITKFSVADGAYQTRPARRPMTLRHLLTHTSGIGYGFASPIVARLQKGNEKPKWELRGRHK